MISPKRNLLNFNFSSSLIALFILISCSLNAQTTGDYRSVATGDWTALSSWQYYNGSTWVTPTSTQGYPGQNNNAATVTISNNYPITLPAGNFYVNINTLTIESGSYLTFGKKTNLILSTNPTLNIYNQNWHSGDCDNNITISTGNSTTYSTYAYCTGGGSNTLTFTNLSDFGGSFNSNPTSNSPVCQGNSINLNAGYTANKSNLTVAYSWTIKDPTGTTVTPGGTNLNPVISNTVTGTYSATLQCTTTYNGTTYSSSKTINISVNQTPTTPSLTILSQPTCTINTGAFTISNYNSSYNYSLSYSPSSIDPNQFTINGKNYTAPTGTYTIKARNISTNCVSTASNTITINPQPTTPSTPVTSITQPNCTVSTGSITVTTQNSGETYSFDNGVNFQPSNNKTGLAAGDYIIIIKSTGGCNSVATTAHINTQPVTLAQPVVTTTQPTCSVLTGSINISSPNGSGITYSIDGSNYSNTTGIFTSLNPGTYNVTAKNSSGCISAMSTVILSSSAGKVWKGTNKNWFEDANWSPAGVPTKDDCVTINNTTSLLINSTTQNAYAYSITVTSGSTLEIAAKSSLTVTNDINVNPGGIFTLQDSANLIQVNEADATKNTNKGSITVNRNTAPTSWNDYTYWSSPTSNVQTLFDFSPNSNPKYFLTYDNIWNYAYPKITKFNAGIGYAIMAPTNATTASQTFKYQFNGIPNNGTITVPVTLGTGSYSSKLVGNPYPSAISADDFILANKQNISGTIYFWTHSQDTSNGSTSSNYATYNLTGGTNTSKGTAASSNPNSGHGNHNAPTFYIASGQGFIIQTIAKGNITFNNNMRVGIADGSNNSNFYRSSDATTNSHQLEKHRIWLNLSDNSANFSQILLGYVEGATNEYDSGFDGAYTNNDKSVLYSLIGNDPYTIQAKTLPFTDTDVIPLGFKAATSGNATISIDNVDGLFAEGQNVYIEDKLTNTTHNLSTASYTFTSEAGTFNDRFVIKYKDDSTTLGVDTFDGNEKNLSITAINHIIDVKCDTDNIQRVFVYDILGKQIYENNNINSFETSISNLPNNQVYIVKAVLASGKSYNKKVIN